MGNKMETVHIDGSAGEGGGQILRTSLALSCITGRGLRMEKIRAARRNPGLAKQHLSCVRAACKISHGRCKGDALGSGVLDFQPGPVRSGDYHFDIGSAGSASLVAQTVMPALFGAYKPSRVTVTGGTHNPWAPPYDFLSETFGPAIASAGFRARCKLIRHGFFPAGGGKMTFAIEPREEQQSGTIDLCERSAQPKLKAAIYTAKLPPNVAERQQKLLQKSHLEFEEIEHIEVEDSPGPGNCAMIRVCSVRGTTVFTSFGQRGKPSQKVIGELIDMTRSFLASGAAVDVHLADQLLIYMAISQAGEFITNKISNHLTTNIEVIKRFLPVEFTADEQNHLYQVSCRPG